MASLKLKHIYKVYDKNIKAVNDVNLDISDKEFIVFVGPSGCGKSTTLRMIAGLEEISSGELLIDNKVVNNIEPKDRDIAMVFQNYALYPHMTVYENMAFGLRIKKIPNEEIHSRIIEASNILGITEYLERKPRAMSGGQRQRVALGRAIVRNPKVFLLDEPLSNLDAKLRTQMRTEILKLHKKLNTTFIYVTHDQVEAMTMGTRIVVMKDGCLQQVDTPKNLYKHPINKFVASFIGTPQMNFINCIMTKINDEIHIKLIDYQQDIVISKNKINKIDEKYFNGVNKSIIGVRSENITIADKPSKSSINVKVSHIEDLGDEKLIYTTVNTMSLNNSYIIVKTHGDYEILVEDTIYLNIDFNNAHFFDYKTDESINNVVPNSNSLNITIVDNYINLFDKKIYFPENVKTFNNGNYRVDIPSDAITLGSDYKAKIENIEEYNGNMLLYLNINEKNIYALMNKNIKVNEFINISIDLKKLTFYDEYDNITLKPLNLTNSTIAKLIKVKCKKETKFKLLIHNCFYDIKEEVLEKIFSSLSFSSLTTTYSVKFSAYDYINDDKGIEMEVIEKYQYNDEKFYKLKYDDTCYIICSNNDYNKGQIVKIKPDFEKMLLIDNTTKIQII